MARGPRLLLASGSPRRRELLAQVGIVPDKIFESKIDERPARKEQPRKFALRAAIEKSKAAARANPDHLVLAADTVVACGRRILPKAATDNEVRECLAMLSGRRHRVYTAVVIRAPDGKMASRVVATHVAFKKLDANEIENYVKSKEGLGKAGGYAVQGRAGAFVRFLNGSYSNVVGLPLYETLSLLAPFGRVPE